MMIREEEQTIHMIRHMTVSLWTQVGLCKSPIENIIDV